MSTIKAESYAEKLGVSWKTLGVVGRLPLFVMLSYGFAFFSYKFYLPRLAGVDFYQYRFMYERPLTFSGIETQAPFIYRQFSAVITHLLYLGTQRGLYYDLDVAFSSSEVSQEVFFAAIMSNYIALVLCAWGVSLVIDELRPDLSGIWPILGGLLCFMSLHAQQLVLTGLTEGWSWALLVFGFLLYLRQSTAGVALVLGFAVIQRETIPIVFGVFAVVSLVSAARHDSPVRVITTQAYQLRITVLAALSFLSYVLMRSVVVPVGGYENQLSPAALVGNLLNPPLSLSFVIQTFLSQNLLILFGVLVVVLVVSNVEFQLEHVYPWHMAAVVVVLLCLGIAAGIGNNTGRILGILTPLVAAFVTLCLASLIDGRPPSATS